VKPRPGSRLDNRGGECQGPRKSVTLGGQQKSDGGARQVVGDGMQGRSRQVNQGDLSGKRAVNTGRTGVRAPIVAVKRGNARGAKGRRETACEWKSNMGPVMAIQNGPTRFIATPTGQASRRPGQASPEPAAPHICGRLWARPAYDSRCFFRPRLALSAPGCWPLKREPPQIIPLFYPCFPGTGSFPRSW